MRLDKLLAHAGRGSRSDVRALIAAGRVTVGGHVVRDAGAAVDEADDVRVDGQSSGFRARFDLMLHKPTGVLTATTDPRQPTVLDLLEERHRKSGVVPVGRLDKDVTGLLILTTDGELAHRLTSPRWGIPKVYEANVEGTLAQADIGRFASGVALAGFTARPARLQILSAGETSAARLTVTEGKYHQVKRMFGALGKPVIALKRVSVAGIALDETLGPGEYRDLTQEELSALQRLTGAKA